MSTVSYLADLLGTEAAEKRLRDLYGDRPAETDRQRGRYARLLQRYADEFGPDDQVMLISAPGRTELCGNHTDHNNGLVMAAAVNLDTLAAVSARQDMQVNLHSEGFDPVRISLEDLAVRPEEAGKPASIIRGIAAAMRDDGLKIGGFDAAVTSDVLTGSGLSSSAAFEVLIAAVLDALYNGMRLDPIRRAEMSQYAENVYFGKPSGLMDQMASSVGGLVAIDFQSRPLVTPLQMDLTGYSLVVVNTGGSHDDLTEDYAAVRREMNAVAACFGQKVLREVPEDCFWAELPRVRAAAGDRAVLRACHYYQENRRVGELIRAVQGQDMDSLKRILLESGRSSWMYLQNVYAAPAHQQLCVALSLAEHLLCGQGAWRVHGGGFAGTTLNLVPLAAEKEFLSRMNAVFGEKACFVLNVRREGAAVVFG
ncbi:MAG: galactokinase [Clostridia bacterium]|nr:galactokinase [Clostridia bacterium]